MPCIPSDCCDVREPTKASPENCRAGSLHESMNRYAGQLPYFFLKDLQEFQDVTAAAEIEFTGIWLMMDPDVIRGNDFDPADLHQTDEIPPVWFRIPAVVKLSYGRQPRLIITEQMQCVIGIDMLGRCILLRLLLRYVLLRICRLHPAFSAPLQRPL